MSSNKGENDVHVDEKEKGNCPTKKRIAVDINEEMEDTSKSQKTSSQPSPTVVSKPNCKAESSRKYRENAKLKVKESIETLEEALKSANQKILELQNRDLYFRGQLERDDGIITNLLNANAELKMSLDRITEECLYYREIQHHTGQTHFIEKISKLKHLNQELRFVNAAFISARRAAWIHEHEPRDLSSSNNLPQHL